MNRRERALYDTTRDFSLKRPHGCAIARQRVMTKMPVFRHHLLYGLKMTVNHYSTYTNTFSVSKAIILHI